MADYSDCFVRPTTNGWGVFKPIGVNRARLICEVSSEEEAREMLKKFQEIFPDTLFFCEPLAPDGDFLATPTKAGQEAIAASCGYSPDDTDYLLWAEMSRVELLRTGKGKALYGLFRRGGCNNREVWREYYLAWPSEEKGRYEVRWQKGLQVDNGRGVIHPVRGYRMRK